MKPLAFEWSPSKAAANLRKHGVALEEAMTAFADPLARIHDDLVHSDLESREILVGHSASGRLLVVAFTERYDRIRLISARLATSYERSDYEESRLP